MPAVDETPPTRALLSRGAGTPPSTDAGGPVTTGKAVEHGTGRRLPCMDDWQRAVPDAPALASQRAARPGRRQSCDAPALPFAPNRRRALLTLSSATLTAAAPLAGCSLLRQPDPVPMRTVYVANACRDTQAPVLLVLLPGVYMTPEELLQQGFVAALRQRGLAVDVLLADAHIGYVRDGSMRRRLRDEVIGPARAWGYQRIWLAGISLGGFVALAYAMQEPGAVEGVLALAPYLGRPELVQAIAAAGGPRAWAAAAADASEPADAPETADATSIEPALWRWLVRNAQGATPVTPAARPQLWLGYGSDDRFAAAHRELATLLSADRTATAPGGHDWAPWRSLWARWLDTGVLPRSCGG